VAGFSAESGRFIDTIVCRLPPATAHQEVYNMAKKNIEIIRDGEFSIAREYEIPLWRKYTLSVQEASKYFRIGDKKLKKLIDENPNAEFILWNGTRPQIKRKVFEQFIDEKLSAI
jgi:hypothetical protein